MVIMALDHCRDYLSDFKFNPTDLDHASTIMFFTRWITHYCAPVFIFLTGVSAFLSGRKLKTKMEASRRLFTRGLWMLLLEVTLVKLGWMFELNYSLVVLQVIWAIGWCMIFLSLILFLPWQAILSLGLLMVFGHDLFDGFQPAATNASGIIWHLLHIQGPINYSNGNTIMVIYPLIPWIGVIGLGYCTGRLFTLPDRLRDKYLYITGISAMVLFVLIRSINHYGDPEPWHLQVAWWRTLLSFINCSKYPPSLLYLLMTLGPAITLLPLLEKLNGFIGRIFLVYGRVPFFYYLLHIYLLHGMAVVMSYFFRNNAPVSMFTHPGYSLPLVYVFWLSAVIILYFPCRWFMRVKMNYKWWWLSYL
jgi:uncharacterized membrane protein